MVTIIRIRDDDRDMPNFVAKFIVLKSTISTYFLCLLPHWDVSIKLLVIKKAKKYQKYEK